jgi:hypothetical protein
MSAFGQKQTYALQQAMSALHPIATAKAKFHRRPCQTLLQVYGHHHPDYQRQAAENIGRRPQNVRVIA